MSEQTTSNVRCIRCGYLIGPARVSSWWNGFGPYHSQCTPLVDEQYRALEIENAELKRQLEQTEKELEEAKGELDDVRYERRFGD